MPSTKVLIVSHLFEPSVNEVIKHLEDLGVQWARLNGEEFPLLVQGRVHFCNSNFEASITTARGEVCSSTISAVWFRRAARPALPTSLSFNDREFVRNECSSFLGGFFDLLSARWMNDRDAERKASSKLNQLKIASAIGFRTPRTLITNEASELDAFVNSATGQIIFKPVSGFSSRGADFSAEMQAMLPPGVSIEVENFPNRDADVVFAQLLTSERLQAIKSLQVSPVIFQEFIEKQADIRVTVVGDRIFACRIHSQENNETKVDFRRMVLLEGRHSLTHELIELPKNVHEMCLSLTRFMGLVFGCIDLVQTKDGEFVFLEINPSGQWLWIERRTGAGISLAVAEELSRMTREHSPN